MDIEQILLQHKTRLIVCLQQVSGDSNGPEEGSDAWLLLNALTGEDKQSDQTLQTRFEESGRWLATQGGKLDARLQGLQCYIHALASELKSILSGQSQLLVDITERLYQLQSICVMALVQGYQGIVAQREQERLLATHNLEHRFLALQRVNGVSNS